MEKKSYERLEEAVPGILKEWVKSLEDDLDARIISYLFRQRDRLKPLFALAQNLEDEIKLSEELVKKLARYTSVDYLSKRLKIKREDVKRRLDELLLLNLVNGVHLNKESILYTINPKETNYFLSKAGYEFLKDHPWYLVRKEEDKLVSLKNLFSFS